MEENIKLELERAKLKNYILQKENEILLGTIGIMSRDKEKMLLELQSYKKTVSYRVKRRIRNIIKKQ